MCAACDAHEEEEDEDEDDGAYTSASESDDDGSEEEVGEGSEEEEEEEEEEGGVDERGEARALLARLCASMQAFVADEASHTLSAGALGHLMATCATAGLRREALDLLRATGDHSHPLSVVR